MQEVKKKSKKNNKWVRDRHQIIRNIVSVPLYLYSRFAYKFVFPKKEDKLCGQYLVLFNHQTSFDQFFVALSFKKHLYFVTSEDLFSKKSISKLITWLVAPIPFRKSTADITAVKNCLRIVKEGGSIAMAPEGNRTYSGTTEYIKPSVASLAKSLKLPIAFFRIEGGYGAQPRWSNKIRKGKMRGFVSKILTFEEYKDMSKEELFDIIKTELYVDERLDKTLFKSEKRAEFLDRVVYYCPYCELSEFYSTGNLIKCKKCGREIEYLPDKTLKGKGFDFPHLYVKDWYDAQNDYIRNLDLNKYSETPVFEETVCFRENIYCEKKIIIDEKAQFGIYADHFLLKTVKGDFKFTFTDVESATVLGKNKLNIYIDNHIFQISGDKHFNALKYLNIYFATKTDEKTDEAFLGL